jgi:predicted alpha/beta-fold hydrolase
MDLNKSGVTGVIDWPAVHSARSTY